MYPLMELLAIYKNFTVNRSKAMNGKSGIRKELIVNSLVILIQDKNANFFRADNKRSIRKTRPANIGVDLLGKKILYFLICVSHL